MKKNIMRNLVAFTLESVAKKSANSSGCCIWYQPIEPKSLKKCKCKKEK